MASDLALPKQFSLQEIILHELAKTCWGDDCKHIFDPYETEVLIAHRETVINNLSKVSKSFPKIFSIELPKLLKDKLVNAVICLQQGYREAVIWEEKCKSALPFTVLNPLTAGPYLAKTFIDPTGHFDDLAWAKRYVADENYHVHYRFKLACYYCFENTIVDLWHAMKTKHELPHGGILARILSEYEIMPRLWAYHLENRFDELIEIDPFYADGFYLSGLYGAIYEGHEYAARFFWAGCSDTDKAKFLQEPDFCLLSVAATDNHYGLVNFIYSLLPLEQKYNLISWSNEEKDGEIWSCLLHSPFYEPVLNDILNLPIPPEMHRCLLDWLSFEIGTIKMLVHQTIFKILWDNLSEDQRNEVVKEKESYIITNLAEAKAMDVLKMIIQPLSHYNKERMLLRDWNNAGKSALDKFSKMGDYDALLHYLLFFFIDQNPITQNLSLRADAASFLVRFIKSESFFDWSIIQIPASEREEVNKVIEILDGSLHVLYQLLEQVEQEMPTFHDFFPPKKTHPSLPSEAKNIHCNNSENASQKLNLKRSAEDKNNDEMNTKEQKNDATHFPSTCIDVNSIDYILNF